MKDVLISIAVVIGYSTMLGGLWLYWRRGNRAMQAQQAQRAAEHDSEMAELARQRHLRELEERRRGLLRGRNQSCRFCGVEQGCLTADDVCMDVEACLARAGVPTSAAQMSPVD